MPPHSLRDYALLADGERGDVVGPRGEIVWMCAPRWESGAVIGRCTGQQASTRARAVVRVLGSRHLLQAAVTARAPNALVLRVGAQVDLAHAASMLALDTVGRPLRRAQLADGLIAAIFAVLGAPVPRSSSTGCRGCICTRAGPLGSSAGDHGAGPVCAGKVAD